ncbi:hypothetical protein BDY19DRAFT_504153 [Irpex rosettiformis]|uniref:Uncharacterized protein n=1 Tax=Irpex rosettiformis TaxID=378272 RepID=A0ACB8UEN5_9APHY|nr:hypothetical protein BDY19DRAFT_504153 [Irpex rosettiformis]
MSRICLRTIIPTPRLAQACSSGIARSLHTTPQCKFTAVLAPTPSLLNFNPLAERQKRQESIRWKKLQDFKRNLESEDFTRARVWSSYVDLLNFLRPDEIPLEIHRKVLRRCTISLAQARYGTVIRMQQKMRIRAVHPHEARFQAIIYNMRQAGYRPSASDYYFVLRHFAAVGQHMGALNVLREMSNVGLEKRAKAYELCLQALYRRLTLPTWHEDRPRLASGISSIVFKLLKEMEHNKVQLTSTNVDLCFSIIGEAWEDEPFERLMKLAYGIDLAYPDRPPLEFWDKSASADVSPDSSLSPLHPFPFTTAALNNTVDFLGRKGRIPKLVQAFEVLTTPLPAGVSTVRDSSYLDDADDDFGDDRPEVAPFTPPHAEPNTLTYERLIKWISRNNHAPFARHYLYQAYRADRENEKALRTAVLQADVDFPQLKVPHLMFTTKMLQSVYGLTNREKKLPMMRWTVHMLYRMKRRRRADIIFFRRILEKHTQALAAIQEEETSALSEKDAESTTLEPLTEEAVVSSSSISASNSNNASASSADTQSSPVLETTEESKAEEETDGHEAPISRSHKPRRKGFSPNLHLHLLRREYSRLLILERRMIDVVGRTTQRVKEKLGRRVWASRDIYLRSQSTRVLITKEQWRTEVNYKPRRSKIKVDPEEVSALGLPNPQQPFIRGIKMDFFTPSAPRPSENSGETDTKNY